MLTWHREHEGDPIIAYAGQIPVGTVEEGWRGGWHWALEIGTTQRGQAASEVSAQIEAGTAFTDWLQQAGLRWVK